LYTGLPAVTIKAEYLNHMEWLQFSFSKLRKNSALLSMHWEDFSVGFTINVDTDKYVLEGARNAKGWDELNEAAIYCLENEVALDEGRKWIDQSVAEKRGYWLLFDSFFYVSEY